MSPTLLSCTSWCEARCAEPPHPLGTPTLPSASARVRVPLRATDPTSARPSADMNLSRIWQSGSRHATRIDDRSQSLHLGVGVPQGRRSVGHLTAAVVAVVDHSIRDRRGLGLPNRLAPANIEPLYVASRLDYPQTTRRAFLFRTSSNSCKSGAITITYTGPASSPRS